MSEGAIVPTALPRRRERKRCGGWYGWYGWYGWCGALLICTLTACGGGGGSSSSNPIVQPPPPPPEPEPTPICELTITTPEEGSVTSGSGDFDCPASSQCVYEVETDIFEETFSASGSANAEFSAWEVADDGLCQGEGSTCELALDLTSVSAGACFETSDGSRAASLAPAFTVSPPQSGNTFDISGSIAVLNEAILDADTNNPENAVFDNNSPGRAQRLATPTTVGGYLNDPITGAEGVSYLAGDFEDYFLIEGAGGYVASLFIADYLEADLDLYLFDENGVVVATAAGVEAIDQIVIPDDQPYFLAVSLFQGASNYTLSIGLDVALQQSTGEIVPGEVLVAYGGETVLSASVANRRRQALLDRFSLSEAGGGIARARRLRSSNATLSALGISDRPHLQRVADQLQSNPELLTEWQTRLLAKSLRHEPGVSAVAPNYRLRANATTNDSFVDFLWHYQLIKVPSAWDITTGTPEVIVAVVDTGIIAQHPDMQGQLVAGYDFIANADAAGDGDGIDPDPTDTGEGSNTFRSGNFHGLHVSGTIAAAGNNGRGIAGVAYGSQLMPLRALGADGSGTSYDIMQAIRFAAGLSNDSGQLPARRADVINLSLGGGSFNPIEQDLFTAVSQRGILVAAASGNDGAARVDYPAAYDHVFAVGATDAQAVVAPYSNRGPALDLVAPGGRGEFDLNGDGQPDGVLSTYYADGFPEYVFLEGTSMAAPHVAGVFALMRSVNSDLDSAAMESLLRSGAIADDLGANGRDNTYGYGLINARKAVSAALSASGGGTSQPAELGLSSSRLNFGSSLTAVDVILSNVGDEALSVAGATVSADWLSAEPAITDASGLGAWRIAVSRAGLDDGSYTGTVTFNGSAGDTSLQVNLRVDSGGASGNVGRIYVLFIDAETQEVIRQATTSVDDAYAYQLTGIPEGRYEIWAGTDTDNDFVICDEGETCGAYPTLDLPATLTLDRDISDLNLSSDYRISLPSDVTGTSTNKPVATGDSWPRRE